MNETGLETKARRSPRDHKQQGFVTGRVWLCPAYLITDKTKIDMAHEIFVINNGGYIGSSTRNEINYAIKAGKTVKYLES